MPLAQIAFDGWVRQQFAHVALCYDQVEHVICVGQLSNSVSGTQVLSLPLQLIDLILARTRRLSSWSEEQMVWRGGQEGLGYAFGQPILRLT